MFTSKCELSLGKNIRGKYILHTLIKKLAEEEEMK